MLEMAWQLVAGLDLQAGSTIPQTVRCPYLESHRVAELLTEEFLRGAGLWPEDESLQAVLQVSQSFFKSLTLLFNCAATLYPTPLIFFSFFFLSVHGPLYAGFQTLLS